MDRRNVSISCGAHRADSYLRAIDALPDGVYDNANLKFNFTVCKGAATFIPDKNPDETFDVHVPENATSVNGPGGRASIRFDLGSFTYELRKKAESYSNDGSGDLTERLKDDSDLR